MRITFVVPGLDLSGGARIVAGHASRLIARGHEVAIVAPAPGRPTLKNRLKTLIAGGASRIRPDQSHFARMKIHIHVANHEGPLTAADIPDADVVVGTWWRTIEWLWALPPEKGAKVHFIQGYDAVDDHPAEPIENVWRLPVYKIAVAQWLIDLGKDRFGIDGMALVPNSVEEQFFTAVPRKRSAPPTVGFLFHDARVKDMPTTLAALNLLKVQRPETQFITFGAYIPKRGQLPKDTEFHLLPRQAKIAALYRKCDAWISASTLEGFNLPPLEAMASRCPVVCSKTGRPLEIIIDGINGYLVDQGDVERFAEALNVILSLSDADWEMMSEAAFRTVEHPNWQESSERFESALIEAVKLASVI